MGSSLFARDAGVEILQASISTHTENIMNNDQVKGQIKQVKGQIKEATGHVLGDKTLENKGKIENTAGKIQKSYGDVKEDIKNVIKKGS
jgi:uncharacterized protein YjbJ (UPF0337 family)